MKKIFFLALGLMMSLGVQTLKAEPNIYASYSSNKLTLYYGEQKNSGDVTKWSTFKSYVIIVVLDESMKDARPESTSEWFLNFTELEHINHLDYLNTSEVTDMSYMFYGCKKLKTLDVSHFDTKNVKYMSYMFWGCTVLTALDVRYFDTQKVLNMTSMFAACQALTSLNVCGFDISNVKDMGGMFTYCTALKTIYCDNNWSTIVSKLVYTKNMFEETPALEGGKGTKYASTNPMDITYARPDESGSPGYFTHKEVTPKEVYTVFKDSTLTYYYDDKKDKHPSDAIVELYLPYKEDHVRFATYADKVKKAVIDPSMQDAKLTSFLSMFYNWTDVSVENGGMHNLENLETITGLKYLDTSEATSLSCMFAGCWKLKGPLDLSRFNTSKVEWMNMMFSGCSELTELDLTSFDVSSLKSTEIMFSGCSKLKTIYCNIDWTAAGISSSNKTFEYCTVLEGENGTKWKYSNPDDITYACPDETGKPGYFTKKAKIEIYAALSTDQKTMTLYYDRKREERGGVTDWTSKYNVETVILDESMKDALPTSTRFWFSEMSKLTDIQHLEYLNTSRVETMEGMFYKCAALTTLDLTTYNMLNANVTTLMFSQCAALKTIYCSDNWSARTKLTDSQNMFYGCTSLEGGNGTKYDDANPKDKTYAHLDESGNPGYFTKKTINEIYAVQSTDKTTMTLYYDNKREASGGVTTWSDFNSTVTTIVLDKSMTDARPTSTKHWFYMFSKLTEIQHLEYLNTSEVKDMLMMFCGCGALTTLDLANFDTKNVEDMSFMLSGCSTLTSLDLKSFDTKNVTTMSCMFALNTNLKDLNLSTFNTENVTNMSSMFWGCSALTSLDLTNFDIQKVTNTSSMFDYCPSLKTIYCNEDWSKSTALTDSDSMFADCPALVGGNGTKYNDVNPKDITYAHPDEDGNPGYFTKKTATGIETITNDQSPITNKIIKDNQILILRDGKTYTVDGRQVK